MSGGNDGGSELPHLAIEILKSIRDEVKGLREETRDRLEGIDGRLEGIDGRLEGIDGRLELHGKGIVKLRGETSDTKARIEHFLTGTHRTEHVDLRAEHEALCARVDRIEARLDRSG